MNLYLPSVKLGKKVRVGSKPRRVYDAAQTPLERVVACAQARKKQVAELKQLRQSLDPFQLGKVIDQKLERIYEITNRRLIIVSPKATQQSRAAHGKEKTQSNRRNGCGKAAPWKSKQTFPPSLQIAQKARDSHFPTAATAAGLRLHFQCLDGRPHGYIFKWLDTNSEMALKTASPGRSAHFLVERSISRF
jgi:hypothetical protein